MIHNGIYIINDTPQIISTVLCRPLGFLSNFNGIKGAMLLLHLPYYHANIYRMARTKWRLFNLQRRGFDPVLVTNTSLEDSFRKLFFISGFQSMHYVYVNENDYQIIPVEKKYDAIYTSQMHPAKRLGLAKDIQNLYVLTYKAGVSSGFDLHSYCPELQHAKFNREWKGIEDKNLLYNSSRVGLALSKVEGPMLACLEYMLCGLPVVSTKSKGGRDQYFDDAYVLVVKDNARAIKEGVDELISRNLDPEFIRSKTIEKLNKNKLKYVQEILSCVWRKHKVDLDEKSLYDNLFPDTKSIFHKFEDL